MYERFTDRARKVMQLANREAKRFNHEYIGTEHILLGLVKEGSGVAAQVLKHLNIDLQKTRLEVEKIVQSGPQMFTMGRLGWTINRHPEIWVLGWAVIGSVVGAVLGDVLAGLEGALTGAVLGTAVLGTVAFLILPAKRKT